MTVLSCVVIALVHNELVKYYGNANAAIQNFGVSKNNY